MNSREAEEPQDEPRLLLIALLTGELAPEDPRALVVLGDPRLRRRYEELREVGGRLDRLAAAQALSRVEAETDLEDRIEIEARAQLRGPRWGRGDRRLTILILAAAVLALLAGVAYWLKPSKPPEPRPEYHLQSTAKLRVAAEFARIEWDPFPAGTVVQVRVHSLDGSAEIERSRPLSGNTWEPEQRSTYPEAVLISLWRVGPNAGRIGEPLVFGRDGAPRPR